MPSASFSPVSVCRSAFSRNDDDDDDDEEKEDEKESYFGDLGGQDDGDGEEALEKASSSPGFELVSDDESIFCKNVEH